MTRNINKDIICSRRKSTDQGWSNGAPFDWYPLLLKKKKMFPATEKCLYMCKCPMLLGNSCMRLKERSPHFTLVRLAFFLLLLVLVNCTHPQLRITSKLSGSSRIAHREILPKLNISFVKGYVFLPSPLNNQGVFCHNICVNAFLQ